MGLVILFDRDDAIKTVDQILRKATEKRGG